MDRYISIMGYRVRYENLDELEFGVKKYVERLMIFFPLPKAFGNGVRCTCP
jgi:hypothetical protein